MRCQRTGARPRLDEAPDLTTARRREEELVALERRTTAAKSVAPGALAVSVCKTRRGGGLLTRGCLRWVNSMSFLGQALRPLGADGDARKADYNDCTRAAHAGAGGVPGF